MNKVICHIFMSHLTDPAKQPSWHLFGETSGGDLPTYIVNQQM